MKTALKYLYTLKAVCLYMVLGTRASAQIKPDNSLLNSGLKGKVQSVTYYIFKANQKQSDEWNAINKEVYNRQGNCISFIIYNNNLNMDSIALKAVYKYDKTGRQLQSIETGNGKNVTVVTYTKNNKGNLIEVRSKSSKLTLRKVYNKQGNLDTLYTFDVVGKLNTMKVYQYYANSKDFDELYYRQGDLVYTEIKKLDKSNKVVSEFHYKPNGVRESRKSYKYDMYGNITMQTDSNSFYIGGYGRSWQENNEDVRVYTYKDFDKAGNWLQRNMVDKSGKAIYTIKREITYY